MTNLTLYFGDSNIDESIRQILEGWIRDKSGVTLEYLSIHVDPTAVVRLGITELPALVLQEEIVAQGAPINWVLPLLDRVFANHANE
jgi:hypothetical protein